MSLLSFTFCNSKTILKTAAVAALGFTLWGCDSNNSKSNTQATVSSSSSSVVSSASSSSQGTMNKESFTLNFKAQSNGVDVDCSNMVTGFGPTSDDSIGINDLRFYVSNVKFYDTEGAELAVTLNDNEFQLNHASGSVALVDLTSNTEGTCTTDSIDTGLATEPTNLSVVGEVDAGSINAVSFDVGVPQALMQAIIGNHSENDAPAPLKQLMWSWVGGYRHFLFNFVVMDGEGTYGEGFIHLGSRGCTANPGELALQSKDQCDFVNTAQVRIENFNPSVNNVVVDINQLLNNLAFTGSNEVDGQQVQFPGVSCHSNTAGQPDCTPLYTNLGLSVEDGSAAAANNSVFVKE